MFCILLNILSNNLLVLPWSIIKSIQIFSSVIGSQSNSYSK
nr:MAG TPA: hypothetical protein [Caudoviricetes sp.]